jgi:hypothetical protein
VSSCRTRPTATSGAGTVIEIGGECGVAPPCYLPAQRRVGCLERVAVEFGAGVVEARDAAPDVARLGGVAFCFDREVADNVDALAGGGMLEGYVSCPDDVDLADSRAVQPGDGAAGPAEEDVSERGPLIRAGVVVYVEHDLPWGARLHAVEIADDNTTRRPERSTPSA